MAFANNRQGSEVTAEPSAKGPPILADNLAYPGHPVIREILGRRNSSQAFTPAQNPARLGLVVEGGGMRGVISGGALVAMERLGLSDVFDEVYGESAGAINACYFLAHQARFGITIYLEDLPSLRFVNPLRLGRMLDLDYAIDEVVAHVKPLDVERVLQSRSRLSIAVTKADDATTRIVDIKKERIPLLALLKATSAIAPLYSRPVLLDGTPYVDGGIVNPIPVTRAIEDGCTHLLVLLTRTPRFVSTGYGRLGKFFVKRLFAGWDARFVRAFFNEQSGAYNRTRAIAFGRAETKPGLNIAVIAPSEECPLVSLTTVSRPRLIAASRFMEARTTDLFTATGV
jgi:predicted patatin/cPLA2 family phospholipase